jgi:uncharacterized protein (TIGR03382 family)
MGKQLMRGKEMRWPISAVVVVLFGLSWSAVSASEYVGLWRMDVVSPGIHVAFPDNGFGGACVAFSNGGVEAGEVRLESQINRHRFTTLTFFASGNLDPATVHVQTAVKGKTAWGANDFDFSQLPVAIQLDGYEVTIEAKELAESEYPWTMAMCALEFSNPRYNLRFTSDCAGFDFVDGDDFVKVVVDEDWLALEREIVGGMGLFGLTSAWGDAPVELTCETTFPEQLFYTALAVDDLPLIQPQVGTPATMTFESGTTGDHAVVVKAKGPVVGKTEWKTTLSWQEQYTPPEVKESDLRAADSRFMPDLETGTDISADLPGESGQGNGGCDSSGSVGGSPLLAFLLALLALLRYHRALCRHSRLENRM